MTESSFLMTVYQIIHGQDILPIPISTKPCCESCIQVNTHWDNSVQFGFAQR